MININVKVKLEPVLRKTYLTGGHQRKPSGGFYHTRAITITIPAKFCDAYNLREPTTVLVTPTADGILISKIDDSKLEIAK